MLRGRRQWYYVALVLFVVSVLTRQPLPLLAAVFTLLIGLVPALWFHNALKHLLVRQQVDHEHLFFGEKVTLSISIENRKLLPLPWLQVEDAVTPPLMIVDHQATRLRFINRDTFVSTWLLWSFQRVTRRYRMNCRERGFHVLGPVRLRSSDPFGWLERELLLPANEMLLVYPLIAPLEALGLPDTFPMGERIGPRQLLQDPLWFAGLREYQMGDDPRRIDWKATARAGELRSKLYESTTERHLLILLDTWAYSRKKKGVDVEMQEFAIAVAASLATRALEDGYIVGFLTNCAMVTASNVISTEVNTNMGVDEDEALKSNATTISLPGVRVPFALDHAQYEQILTTLARLMPAYHTPIERIIELEDEMFPGGTTIVLISPRATLSEDTINLLLERRRQGNAATIVLVGDAGEEAQAVETVDTASFPVYHVGGKERWYELVRTIGGEQGGAVGTSSTRLQLD
ncbi:MAG: DUF58 domain-containing protein [Ktedonobacteraceae bacterium]